MPELPPLQPQGDLDGSFIESIDWLPGGIFQRSKNLKTRASHIEPVELQPTKSDSDEARPTTPHNGGGPSQTVEKALSDTSSESERPEPMRFRDDVFDPAREVK